MRTDVPRPLVASGDVAHPYAPLSVDVDITRPTYDLSVPTASEYTLSSGNIDVIDMACTPGPSSVDVPRPTVANVHRSMSAVGVRPPKSSVLVDVVASLPGPAPPMRVDNMGQQRLGRPTSVDVAIYPGLPSASLDVVHQPTCRLWVLVLLGLHPLVLTLCTRRPWALTLLGLCLLVVCTHRLWVPVLSGLRRPTLPSRLVRS